MATFAKLTYTPAETTSITQWVTTSSELNSTSPPASLLSQLNTHLATRTTILGSKPSEADTAIYAALAPLISRWTREERTGEHGYHNIVRHADFVQNSKLFGLGLKEGEKVKVDPDDVLFVKAPLDPKAEKERLKKEKAAAADSAMAGSEQTTVVERVKEKQKEVVQKVADKAAVVKEAAVAAVVGEGSAAAAATAQPAQKKEKKEKAPKPQKAPATSAALSPSLIDLRVGHILKAVKHPEADSLYVSTIAMGDQAGTEDTSEYEGQIVRTVCSGLNGLVPLEEMQGRKVVVVCNLKPVKMRGIKSAAMVLAASPRLKEGEEDHHAGPVELVSPPEGAKAGERVYFEGWKGEPEGVLNPKKKVWETIQPGFTTTPELDVGFDAGVVKELSKDGEPPKTSIGRLMTESGELCKVKSLTNGIVR